MPSRKNNKGGRRDRYGKWKTVTGSLTHCHLCLLPLHHQIVCTSHPLFTTLDHVIPISKGGRDIPTNRQLAHLFCNKAKANKIDVYWKDRINMAYVIIPLLRQQKVNITRRQQIAHRNMLCERFEGPVKYDALPDLIRWEDEGGAIYVKPHWRK
jgi:hypothetical protein